MKKFTVLFLQLLLPLFVLSQNLVSVSPASANSGQSLNVTITGVGTHFKQGSSTVVGFDGIAINVISNTVLNDTSITANITIPVNAYTGNYNVYIKDSVDGKKYLYNTFHINGTTAPSLVSISPSHAIQGQTLNVTITGVSTHFSQGSPTAIVSFGLGSISINSKTILNDTSISANITIPSNGSSGSYDVYINSSKDGYLQLTNGFMVDTIPHRALVSITPNSAVNGQTLDVIITGTRVRFSQNTIVGLTGISTIENSKTIINDTSIMVNITIPANTFTGDYAVYSIDSINGNLNLPYSFHIDGLKHPYLDTITPSTVNAGQALNALVIGKYTHFLQGKTLVGFGTNKIIINSQTILNDTAIRVNITVPANMYTGDYSVNTNDSIAGQLDLFNSFHVNGITPPSLVSVTPNKASAGQTLDVTVTGSHTHFSQGSTSFSIAGLSVSVNSITVLSDSTLKVNITIPYNVYNGGYGIYTSDSIDGYISLPYLFFIDSLGTSPSSLISISPAIASNGQTLNVTITGTKTHFTQASSTTFLGFSGKNNITINSTNIMNDSILKANITIPANAFTGDYTFYINNPIDGHLELVNSFHVNGLKPPLLVSISPNKASAGQTLNVTITGSNTHFSQGSSTPSVSFEGGISVNSQSILNDSSISANISIPYNIYPRGYSISVFDSVDGNMSLLNSFYIDSAGYNSCYSHFTTNYDSINNKFTLVIDSITSAKAISFNWDFGDGNSSTNETPVHTFLADAIYNVCLKIVTATGDSCSYCHPIGKDSLGNVYRQSGFSMSVVRYNGITTGISENTSFTSIDVYPNPANSFVTIVTNQKITDEKPIISLYNMKGELILQQNLVQNKTELDINGFANGIYLVHVTCNGKSDVIKFIKQ